MLSAKDAKRVGLCQPLCVLQRPQNCTIRPIVNIFALSYVGKAQKRSRAEALGCAHQT